MTVVTPNNSLIFASLRDSFLGFCHYTYDNFQSPAHVKKIAEALEKVERGEIKRLIISLPPRHYKSTLVAHLFAAWYLGRHPNDRVVTVCFGSDLSEKHSKDCRRIIKKTQYKKVFPGIHLAADAHGVTEWDLEGYRGGYKATSTTGAITGHGANLLIIDDPHKNREEANSETIRQQVWDAYTTDLYPRLQPNPEEGAVIVIHTRYHEDDLIGRFLENQKLPDTDKWHEVRLPAVDESKCQCKICLTEYPRESDAECPNCGSEESDPLRIPLFWPLDVYDKIKANSDPITWASVWQGDPLTSEGDQFRLDFFKIEKSAPDLRWVRYWDLAYSTGGDYTVGALVGKDEKDRYWIKNIVRMKGLWPDVRARIIKQAELDPYGTVIGFPRDALGKTFYDELRRDPSIIGNRPVAPPFKEAKKKVIRAAVWHHRAAAGDLYLVEAPWNDEFIRECLAFPNGKHDDQVDAISGAVELLYWTRGGGNTVERDIRENTYEWVEALIQDNRRAKAERERIADDWWEADVA